MSTAYKSYPVVRSLYSCGPSRYEFDAQGNGRYVWSACFDVVAEVYRRGGLDIAEQFFFRVLDKRDVAEGTLGLDQATEWTWRTEGGLPCEAPVDANRVELATEGDYYDRILPALKRIERSFYASFAADFE